VRTDDTVVMGGTVEGVEEGADGGRLKKGVEGVQDVWGKCGR
jgi:hypothetical protein